MVSRSGKLTLTTPWTSKGGVGKTTVRQVAQRSGSTNWQSQTHVLTASVQDISTMSQAGEHRRSRAHCPHRRRDAHDAEIRSRNRNWRLDARERPSGRAEAD